MIKHLKMPIRKKKDTILNILVKHSQRESEIDLHSNVVLWHIKVTKCNDLKPY